MVSLDAMQLLHAVLYFSKPNQNHHLKLVFQLLQSTKHHHILIQYCLRLSLLSILPNFLQMHRYHRNVQQNDIFQVEWMDSHNELLTLILRMLALDFPVKFIKKFDQNFHIFYLLVFLWGWIYNFFCFYCNTIIVLIILNIFSKNIN